MWQRLDIRQFNGIMKNAGYIELDRLTEVLTGFPMGIQTLFFAYQRTGYGMKRFFICPECGRHCEYLYRKNRKGQWKCSGCSGRTPYWGLWNTDKGSYQELAYRMDRIADKIGIKIQYPYSYVQYQRMDKFNDRAYCDALRTLQALENMRLIAIEFHKRYDRKTIQAVIKGTHPIMMDGDITCKDLEMRLYDWEMQAM